MLGVKDSAHFGGQGQCSFSDWLGFSSHSQARLLFVATEEGYYLPALMVTYSLEQYRMFFFSKERPSIVDSGKQ